MQRSRRAFFVGALLETAIRGAMGASKEAIYLLYEPGAPPASPTQSRPHSSFALDGSEADGEVLATPVGAKVS